MYYLEVAHVEDNDSDLFRFKSLSEAVQYIESNQLTDWNLSSMPRGFPEDDYTLVLSEIAEYLND